MLVPLKFPFFFNEPARDCAYFIDKERRDFTTQITSKRVTSRDYLRAIRNAKSFAPRRRPCENISFMQVKTEPINSNK